MKRVRLTHEGAYHHCMNRGINGLNIFSGHEMKSQFLNYLEDAIGRYKLRRMRGELLVRLKDLGGLRYSEISKLTPFENYRLASMAKLYRDTKRRLSKTLPDKVTK